MKKEDQELVVRCDCHSEIITFDYFYWGEYDNEKDCDLSIGLFSYYPTNPETLWGKIKLAVRVLFGYKIYKDHVSIRIDKIKQVRDFFNSICQDNKENSEEN